MLKKYPVMVYVYGGSHTQLVNNRWLGGAGFSFTWHNKDMWYLH